MWEIFLKTLPFFAIIGLGYGSGRVGFFTEEATAYLTKFVFYFALPAMLFRFSATLEIGEVFNWSFIAAYLGATLLVYLFATVVSHMRGSDMGETAVEAQCSVIGNVGFLGIPMLALLLGEASIAPIILVLSVDLIVFSSLIVILITLAKTGTVGPRVILNVVIGLFKNPMIVAISLGFVWSAFSLPVAAPADEFLTILGAAATPGALFAIGASLATKTSDRISIAAWISFNKLILHPAAVAVAALFVFPVDQFAAGVMIAAAALPVAGNVYILAEHYKVAPQRASASILLSTTASVVTVAAVIAWIGTI